MLFNYVIGKVPCKVEIINKEICTLIKSSLNEGNSITGHSIFRQIRNERNYYMKHPLSSALKENATKDLKLQYTFLAGNPHNTTSEKLSSDTNTMQESVIFPVAEGKYGCNK